MNTIDVVYKNEYRIPNHKIRICIFEFNILIWICKLLNLGLNL